jgi:hypothetical protein
LAIPVEGPAERLALPRRWWEPAQLRAAEQRRQPGLAQEQQPGPRLAAKPSARATRRARARPQALVMQPAGLRRAEKQRICHRIAVHSLQTQMRLKKRRQARGCATTVWRSCGFSPDKRPF